MKTAILTFVFVFLIGFPLTLYWRGDLPTVAKINAEGKSIQFFSWVPSQSEAFTLAPGASTLRGPGSKEPV